MSRLAALLAGAWLLVLGAYAYGVLSVRWQVFPYSVVQEIEAFIAGAANEDLDVAARIESDAGGDPHRFLYPRAHPDTAPPLSPLAVTGLRERRAAPEVFLAPDAPRGYRIVFGAFDFKETLWGALLLGPDGAVVHQWRLSSDHMPNSTEPSHRKNMYGVWPFPDGSIIFATHEEGGGLVKVDGCSQPVWGVDGLFHHTVQPQGPEMDSVWTYEGTQATFDHVLTRLDVETGARLQQINMRDVRAANPDTHIFYLQRAFDVPHAIHGNDIDPLPAARAEAFPGFETGDLLISFNTINLVFVLDPETLRIKWWRVGPWDRQHDPDWGADGRITVYANNAMVNHMTPPVHSDIVAIDPDTYETEILVDGAAHDFRSVINGMHQVTPAGTILVTSATQGRAFEVTADGRVVFDFVNTFDHAADVDTDQPRALHLSDALFLPLDYFEPGALPTECPGPEG